jgi:hypothetical protein
LSELLALKIHHPIIQVQKTHSLVKETEDLLNALGFPSFEFKSEFCCFQFSGLAFLSLYQPFQTTTTEKE